MISGRDIRGDRGLPRLRAAWAGALSVLLLWAGAAAPAETGVAPDQLMQGLRQVRSASARFVERKTLHMLSEPLESSGTLRYVAPDRLEKVTLEPEHQRLAVDGDTLVIEDADERSRTLSLSENPEIGALVESIRATLAGDLTTLTRLYQVSLEGDAAQWHLRLEPRSAKLRDLVTCIRISGTGYAIRLVETESADGDHAEMSISEDAP